MNPLMGRSILLVVVFAICGCATPNEFTMDRFDREIAILGMSLLPPQGDGWYYRKVHPARLIVGKMGNGRTQSIAGMIVLSKLPEINTSEEFLALVSEQRSREPTPPRFVIVLNEESLSNEREDFCVRFHTVQKDYEASTLPDTSDFLIVEDIGVMFRHPYNKNAAVTIALSQRTEEDKPIVSFELIANEFIKNAKCVQFTQD